VAGVAFEGAMHPAVLDYLFEHGGLARLVNRK
jgi:hypothetical protein